MSGASLARLRPLVVVAVLLTVAASGPVLAVDVGVHEEVGDDWLGTYNNETDHSDQSEDETTEGDEGNETTEGDGDGDSTDSGDGSSDSDGDSSSGSGDQGESDTGYLLEQAGNCYAVEPLSGSEPVEDFYDWSMGSSDYSSGGTTDLQDDDTSILFLYEGPDGTVSLVVVHDKLDGSTDGGAATFEFQGMPSDGSWVVQDDYYEGDTNYDNWNVGGSTHIVDWTWTTARTDGGAFGPVGTDVDVTIDPAFNEEAALYGDHYDGNVTDWELLTGDGNPDRHSLDMGTEVSLRAGSCEGDDSDDDDSSDDGSGDSGDNADDEDDGSDDSEDGDDSDDSDDGDGNNEGDGSDESDDGPSRTFTPLEPRFEHEWMRINRTTVPIGQPVEVKATIKNEGPVDGEYIGILVADFDKIGMQRHDFDRDETKNVTFVKTFNHTGTYHIRLDHEFVGRLEVTPPPEPAVNASVRSNTTVAGNVTNASANTTVGSALPATNASAVSLDWLTVTVENETDRLPFTVETFDSVAEYPVENVSSASTNASANATNATDNATDADATDPANDSTARNRTLSAPGTGYEPLGYVTLRHNGTHDPIEAITMNVSVANESVGADRAEAVTVLRYDESDRSWEGTAVSLTNASGDRFRYAVNASGFGTFAVVERRPAFGITGADVSDGEIEPDESVSVTAEVENAGVENGTYETALRVDGDEVTAQNVTVEPGGVRTVEFSHAFEAPGRYRVGVGNATAGVVTVEQRATTTEASVGQETEAAQVETTAAETTDEPTETTTTTTGPGFGAVAGIVGVAVALAAAVRRRR